MNTVPLLTKRAQVTQYTPLFELDALLPAQWASSRSTAPSGEWKLCRAVLADAIDILKKAPVFAREPKGRRLYDDTVFWVASADRAWPFSFENVCEVLGLDPEAVRGAIKRNTVDRIRRPGVIVQQDRRPSVGVEPATYGANASVYAPSYTV